MITNFLKISHRIQIFSDTDKAKFTSISYQVQDIWRRRLMQKSEQNSRPQLIVETIH